MYKLSQDVRWSTNTNCTAVFPMQIFESNVTLEGEFALPVNRPTRVCGYHWNSLQKLNRAN